MKNQGLRSLLYALTATLLAAFAPGLHAQTGSVDSGFDPAPNSNVFSAVLQVDGKIIVGGSFTNLAGTARNRIARLNADGTLDSGFNPNASSDVNAIAIQADGKIVIAGAFTNVAATTRNRIARLNADGTLDTGFNPNASNVVNGLALQSDGKIIVGGNFTGIGAALRNRLARLNTDGTLDISFNPNASSNVYALAIQLDGKILVGGDFTNVAATARNYFARLNADGTLDSGFNPNPSNSVYNANVQADGKIVIGGNFTTVGGVARNRIARLNAGGTLDSGFNPNASNTVNSVVLQADGQIIIGGSFTNVGGATIRNRIARLNADGTLEATFNPNASGVVSSIAVQANGQVIVGGTFTNVGGATRTNLARIQNDAATQSLTVPNANRVEWLRGGTSPEAQAVAFDFSTDGGVSWIALGSGVRIAGGWEMTGLSLPASGIVRGRARVPSGIYNGSSGLLEASAAFSGFTSSAPIVTTGNATNVTDVTASLTAIINPAGAPTTAQFEYGTTTNYGSVANIILSPTNGASVQNVITAISGLIPGTNYNFRAIASNSVGLTFGSNQTFSTPLLPEIAVEHPTGTNLTDGTGSISFGLSQVGVTNQPRTFIIRNVGLTNLTGIVITKDGTHSNDFTLNTNGMSTTLAPGGSTTFSLVFTAAATGLRTAAVHIASSDPDENPFDIGLIGSGYQPGNVDTNFILGTGNTVHSMGVQPDGKVVVGGFFTTVGSVARSRLARYNTDGTLDSVFNPNANSDVYSLAVQGDGRIVVGGGFSTIAGASRNRIARLNADGTIDAAFNPNISAGFIAYDLTVLPDGKILLAGDFTAIAGATRNRIARLHTDGTLDTNFNPNVNNTIYSMALQNDGKILIGGLFTIVGGVPRNNFARLNADGTLDTGFAPTVAGTVYCMAVQTDGKILLGGTITTVNGTPRSSFARLNADGTLDSFNPAPNNTVYSLALQADGKLIIAGSYTMIAATVRNRAARFNTNNALDGVFNPDANNLVYGMAIQGDGMIVLGGQFTTVGGAPRTNIARVFNDGPTQTLTVASANRIEWLRGGAAPEAQSVTFELSSDNGSNWVALGAGSRISGGWEATGFTLPASGLVRGRARIASGGYNGSAGLTEATALFSGFAGSAPLVVTGGASNITDIAATLYAVVNPAGAGTTATFEYGTTTNYGSIANIIFSPTNGATTQTVSAAISGLTPGTTYHYRIAASNSVGTTYGNDLTFGTLLYPDIVVEQPSGTNLLDGLSTNNFGFSLLGTTNAPRTFIIRNIGLTNLTGLVITKDGTHTNDFILDTNGMSTSIAPGASTAFSVIFVTGSTGTRTAAIHIANNDPDENPFDIALAGNGYRAGDLETNFNPSATGSSVSISGLAIQPDGRMILGGDFTGISGTTRGFLVRLNLDGTIDPAFTNANASVRTVVLQPDGKVLFGGDFTLVAGVSRNRIARLNANGTLDMTFSNTVGGTVYNMALQPDGKVLIGGTFATVGGISRLRFARLNIDGSLDATFVTNTPNQDVHALAVLPDGKIMIGGNFTTYGGAARTNIARLNSNGSLDTSFTNKITSAFGTVYTIVMQPDGKMLVGGDFTFVNGVARNRFARFNTDDTLDSLDLNANNTVYSMALQTDGKILVGGTFFNVKGGQPRNYIARLNADGTLDSFNPGSGSEVYAMAIQSDGKIVVGGFFTTMGGVTRNRIARLWNDGVTESFSVASAHRVEWLRGGALMDVPGVTFDFSTDGGVNWIALGAGTPISGGWELTGLSLPPAGQVRARARTFSGRNNGSSGFTETNAAFSGFTPAPPVVLTAPATSINVLSATLNASINPSGIGTAAQFEYGTTTNYGSMASITLSPTNGATAQNVSATIAGLTGGTTYHFRAIASNSAGITFGSNVTFATLTQPEIAVEQPAGTNLTDGVSTVSFGTAMVANAGVLQTFVIRNQGIADLTGLVITKDGAHAADFTLDTNSMSTTVAPGASTTFTVTFAPVSATGARTAAIHIANNDSDENPFDITVTGTAIKAGDLDLAFNPNVVNVSDSVRAAAMQTDGRIVINGFYTSVGGTLRTNIARLNADGTVDPGFNPAPDSTLDALTLESNQKILVGGFFTTISGQARTRIARLNTNGTADVALNSGANQIVSSIIPQPDGKLILCGNFTSVAGQARNRIARLNTDGTVDTNFNPNADGSVTSALVQSDGKIIVWGNFQIIGGMARQRFARLNADGTSDGSYNPANGTDGTVTCAAMQPDGKLLVGGTFQNFSGVSRSRIARLNPDGTADASFAPVANESLSSIAIQTDGRILVAGSFTSIAGAARNFIARLQTNGSIDTLFNPVQASSISGISLQPDGKILITGAFTSSGGQTRNKIARLINDPVNQALTVASGDRVEWLRGGASPEVQRVTFDVSTDGGSSWTPLGAGTRIAGGWELTELSLPSGGLLRAQGRMTGGSGNGASWVVESMTNFAGLPAPEIAVEEPAGINIGDGDNKNFGSVLLGGNASLTFTITNSGTTNLTGLVITKDGTHTNDFTVDTNGMSSTVAAGASTTFTVTFAPGALGARTAAIHIANNDLDETPFDITLGGSGIAPEIVVEQPAGTNLGDGGPSIDFGLIGVGASGAPKTFTISNAGGATLSGIGVTKDGTNNGDFTVDTTGMSTALAPGANTTFTVTFTPSAASTRNAAIHIASDDADENPFDINLTGAGANQSPVVANPIQDQTAITGIAFSYAFPTNTFSDPDAAQTLTYTATKADNSPLPAWLTFTPGTRTFSGTPAPDDSGTLNIKVTATDNGTPNLSVSDEFAVVVIRPPSVTTLTAVNIGPFSATLRADINPNGLPTTALFEYGEDPGYGLIEQIVLGPSDGTTTQTVTAQIDGLQPNTTYHFRARATNNAGPTIGSNLTFTTPAPAVSKWHPAGRGSDGRALYVTHFVNATEGWAVGPNGVMRHTIDSGVSWEEQPFASSVVPQAMGGANALSVWVVGPNGFISMWDGLAWSLQGSGVSTTLRGVWAADGSNAWAVGDAGTLLKWNGSTWSAQSSGVSQNLWSVWGTDANNVWAVGENGLVLKWNGNTWTSSNVGTSERLLSIHGSAANNIWVLGNGGTMFKWNGLNWTAHNSSATGPLVQVWVADANNAWAVGANYNFQDIRVGTVVRWNGTAWSAQPNASEKLRSISGANASNVWAVGEMGLIMKWDSSSWSDQSHGGRGTLVATWGANTNNIWAVGENGTIMRWNGNAWTAQPSPVIYKLWGVWGANATNVWAVGEGGSILKWDGSSWTIQNSGTIDELWGIWGLNASNVWVVGNYGRILKWNGSAWTVQVAPPAVPLRSIWGTDANNIWAAGYNGVIRKYNGTSWVTQDTLFNQNDLYSIWAANTNSIWIGGFNGTRYKWNGSTWQNYFQPGGNFVFGFWGSNPNNVWCSFGGGIQRWNGSTWTHEPAEIAPWAFWGTGPATVFAVGNDGVIKVNADYAPIVTTATATEITSSSAKLNGVYTPRGRPGAAIFQHGLDFRYGVNTIVPLSPNDGVTVHNVSATISGLKPSTFYRFRLVGANGFARDESSEDLGFTTLAGPDIAVEQPTGIALADGMSSVHFLASVGTPVSKTFTVRNTGTLNLTGLSISADGANAADFTVSALGATTLGPGGSTTFDVTFDPSVQGIAAAAIHIASDDPDESPFDISLSGIGVMPEIAVEQPAGTGLTDGSSTVVFANTTIGIPTMKTFTVTNAGVGPLSLTGITKDGPDAADFSVSFASADLAPGSATTFNVTFNPATIGSKAAAIHIHNNDADENPFDIDLNGTASVPEIAVEQPAGTNLTDGATTIAYGSVMTGTPVSKTFTVRNIGGGNLTGLIVSKDGTAAADFTVGALSATNIAPGGSATFNVTFNPSTIGAKTAAIHIANNDADENPFDISLTGSGIRPEILVEEPAGTDLTNTFNGISFGSTQVGVPVYRTVTIRNIGLTDLTGLVVSKNFGGQPEEFGMDQPLATTVPPGGSTTFLLSLNPWYAGAKLAFIQIVSNDQDENPYFIHLTGTGTAAEIAVEQPLGTNISIYTSRDFGSVLVGTNAEMVFTIKNVGTYDLTGLGIYFTGEYPAQFSISASPVAPVPPGGSTTFTARFTPAAAGLKSALLHIANNDDTEDENPFRINLSGTGLAPEIVVEQPSGVNVTNGGFKSFNAIRLGTNADLTFTIKNIGSADLTGLGITIDGTNAADFIVTSAPNAPLTYPTGSTTFTVRFAPAATGTRTAALHISSNDGDESPFNVNLSGIAYVPNTTLQQTYDLAKPPVSAADAVDVLAYGRFLQDFFGSTVRAGDLNGDGVDDFIVGSDRTGANSGAVYVWFGGSDFAGTKDALGVAGPLPDLVIGGGSAGDKLSADNSITVGDINGDGVSDLIIGAHLGDGPGEARTDAGEVYIIFGRQSPASFPPGLYLGTNAADVKIHGANAGDLLGFNGKMVLADVNGDGLNDLILGAPGADGPGETRSSCGEAYIVFGRTNFPATLDLAVTGSSGADVRIYGANANDNLAGGGRTLAVGDLNGDGVKDLLLGARTGDGPAEGRFEAGEAYIVFSRTNAALWPATLDLAVQGNGGANVTVYGAQSVDYVGGVTAGDVNGDGIDDLLLCSSSADGPVFRNFAGTAYVIFGRASPSTFPLTLDLRYPGANVGADVTLYGRSNDQLTFGEALATGDVNGDGIQDILLGAINADGPNFSRGAGEAYIVFGRTNPAAFPLTMDMGVRGSNGASVTIYGASFLDQITYRGVLLVADMNGDGFGDLILQSEEAAGPGESRPDAGEAYIVFGRPAASFPAELDLALQGNSGANITIYGANSNDELTVLGAVATGDVNGDGVADLLLGAFAADGPGETRDFAGEAYVLFGIVSPPTPDIAVEQPIAVNIGDGGTNNFGSVRVAEGTNLTFTIRNPGDTNLSVLSISIDGPDAADFTVISNASSPVVAGSSTTFTVRFVPSGAGGRTAALHIANNDPDENPFDITLTGTGIANSLPTLTRANHPVVVPVTTPATNHGTFGDVDGDAVTLSASVGIITPGAGTWTWTYTPAAIGSETVTITADDGHPGGTNAVTFTLTAHEVTPPVASFVSVSPDPRAIAVGSVTLNFSEDVTGVNAADFVLTRNSSPISLAGLIVTPLSSASFALDLTAFTATPGDYVLTLVAAGSGITDLVGNALAVDSSETFAIAASVSSVSDGNLSVNNVPGGGALALTIRTVTVGGTNYIEIHDANNSIAAGAGAAQVDANTIRVPAASVTNQLQITGGPGDDHFVFDASDGCPLPSGGVNIDGGGQTLSGGDTLQIIGTFSSVQYDANNIGSGNLQDDCGAVNFSGFEPVDYTLATISNLTINVDPLNLFTGPVTTTLSAVPGPGNEANTRVDFSGGLELMDFGTLTGTLTITGDSAEVDTIVVQSVGTNFAGNLALAAQDADSVLLTNTTLTLGTGRSFDVTAGSVTVGAATVSGGTIAFHGGSIAMNIGGAAPGAGVNQYSRLTVFGTVVLSNSPTLNLTGSYVPQPGETFMLIDNDGADAVIGAFAGLPEGANFVFNGSTLHLTYAGGSGNDVVLSVATPPTINCGQNETLNLGLSWDFTVPIVTANCGTATLSILSTTTNQTCGATFVATRVWLATNTCGMSTTCTQVVTIIDVTAPTLVCPSNITVECAAQIPPPDFAGGSATDDGSNPTIVHLGDVSSGVNPRTITRSYRATDACSNSTVCAQTIIVHDTNAPTIDCPADIVVAADTNSCTASGTSLGTPIAVDNCSVTFTNNAPTQLPLGVTWVTWTATDGVGNSAACTQRVTVVDVSLAINSQPQNSTNNIGTSATFAVTAVGCADLSYQWYWATNILAGETNATLTLTNLQANQGGDYVVKVSNAGGSVTSVVAVLMVGDFIAPAITCPSNVTVQCLADVPPANFAGGSVSDNLDPSPAVVHVGDATDGACPLVITRTYRATDASNNTAFCAQTITVHDTTPPVINCGQNETLNVGLSWDFTVPIVSDNCGGAVTLSIQSTATNQNCGRTFVATRIWLASDACGNSTTCTQVVTIIDVAGPALTCPSDLIVACAAEIPTANFAGGSVTDAGDPNPTVVHVSDTSAGSNPRIITRTYRATDACSNATTCSQSITVHDTNAPTITCLADVVVAADTNLCTASGVVLGTPIVGDNCTVTFTNNAPAIFPLGTTLVTWTATDAGGNSSTCTQRVTIIDGSLDITSQPQSSTRNIGTDVTLAVTAAGCPDLDYQWSFGTNVLAGATNAMLALTNIQPSHAGDYSVKVSNAGGSVTSAVAVLKVNTAPVLPVQSDRTIAENTALIVTNAAADADVPANAMVYQLVSPPAGANIDTNGVITWTPGEEQGPGAHTFTTVATDEGGLSATNSFAVFVTEVNLPPAVDSMSDRTVNPGQTITFTATAMDADRPTNTLSFSLLTPPSGASINPNGLFLWRPTMAQRDSTNVIQVRVQDDGSPSLSGTNSFSVIVNPLAPVILKSINSSEFDVSGTAGPDYIIMASPDLLNWTDIATNLSPAIPFHFNDVSASAFSNRFYKVRLAP